MRAIDIAYLCKATKFNTPFRMSLNIEGKTETAVFSILHNFPKFLFSTDAEFSGRIKKYQRGWLCYSNPDLVEQPTPSYLTATNY